MDPRRSSQDSSTQSTPGPNTQASESLPPRTTHEGPPAAIHPVQPAHPHHATHPSHPLPPLPGPPVSFPAPVPAPVPAAVPVHTASFTKPVPLGPIAMPSPATSREALGSSSAPQTPPIYPFPAQPSPANPAPMTTYTTTTNTSTSGNAVAGPSRLPGPASQSQIQESDEEDRTGSSGLEGFAARHLSTSIHSRSGNGNDHGSGNGGSGGIGGGGAGVGAGFGVGGNGGGNGGYGPATSTSHIRSASTRYPERASSFNGTMRQSDRYPAMPTAVRTLPTTPLGLADPQFGGAELNVNSQTRLSRQSPRQSQIWIPQGQNPVNRRGDAMSQGAMSQVATIVNGGEKSVGDRIDPTLQAAKIEKTRAEARAKYNGYALNIAIGAQVVLGALTTGVAAATSGHQASIATSILGGLSTLAASYLAKARGSGEPEASARKAQDLNSFIRDCEAFKLDHGHKIGPDHDDMINRYRRRFEEIMGNEFEGVGDDVKVKRKRERNRDRDREKVNDSPV